MKKILTIVCFLVGIFLSPTASFSQIDTTTVADTSTIADTSGFGNFFSEQEMNKYLEYKPLLWFGIGSLTFYGDVRDSYYKNPLVGRRPFTGGISRKLNPFLTGDFFIIKGNMSGNERNNGRNLNFMTNFFVGGASISYNFYHLLKKPDIFLPLEEQRVLIPYISVGIETMNFNSKADMKDANGNFYHYWSDGTIRNVEESPENEINSVVLQRDYTYETDLRELNLDDLGRYDLSSLGIPISLGFDFYMTKRVSLKFGASYHMMFKDLIDNVSSAGEGIRKGDSKNDNFLYTYVALKVDIFSSEKIINLGQLDLTGIDFKKFDKADEDGDGVVDLWDECPETPPEVAVDTKGCPLDGDKDGVPGFRDDEPTSADSAIVGTNGVTLTEEQIQYFSDSLPAVDMDKICDYYPSMCGMKNLSKRNFVEIPAKFTEVDSNNDKYISLEELNDILDKFFDFKTDLSIDDIYELTEFFFSQ